MLYDPKWPQKQGSLFSRKRFAAWLETKTPEEEYDFESSKECAIGQYLRDNGTSYLGEIDNHETKIMVWNEKITSPEPRTFGAALARARKGL